MTITELLDLPTDDLEKLSDADLAAHLAKYFPHTRPAAALTLSDITGGNDDLMAMVAQLEAAEAKKPTLIRPK